MFFCVLYIYVYICILCMHMYILYIICIYVCFLHTGDNYSCKRILMFSPSTILHLGCRNGAVCATCPNQCLSLPDGRFAGALQQVWLVPTPWFGVWLSEGSWDVEEEKISAKICCVPLAIVPIWKIGMECQTGLLPVLLGYTSVFGFWREAFYFHFLHFFSYEKENTLRSWKFCHRGKCSHFFFKYSALFGKNNAVVHFWNHLWEEMEFELQLHSPGPPLSLLPFSISSLSLSWDSCWPSSTSLASTQRPFLVLFSFWVLFALTNDPKVCLF